MIPVQLTIKGIYSYQEECTINFEQLTGARIFGIFGSVGSGKSTILEAISFALYGETERLHQRDNRTYNMMNLKSDELFIDFIFKTGKANKEYRFTVNGKRNRKNFEKTDPFVRKAYQKSNGDWLAVEPASAPEIIGLSYNNFRRTIIIPQGQFQEFLQLGPKDRTQMLKELFNLGKYELYYKTAALEKKNNEKIQNIEGQLLQLEDGDQSKIKDEQEILAKISEKINKFDKELKTEQKKEVAAEQLKELFKKLSQQKEVVINLKNNEGYYRELDSKIKDYEYCLVHFKELIKRQAEQENKISNIKKDLSDRNQQFLLIGSDLENREKQFVEIKKQFENREDLNQTAVELERIIGINHLNSEIFNNQEKIQILTKKLSELDISIESMKKKGKELTSDLKNKKSNLGDFNELSKIKQWFIIKKPMLQNLQKNENEKQKTENGIRGLEESKTGSIPDKIINILSKHLSEMPVKKIISELDTKKENIAVKIDRLDKEIEHLVIQEKLEDFSKNLEEGKPCPLCGSSHHPDKLQTEKVEQELKSARQRKNEIENSIKSINESLNNLNVTVSKIGREKELLVDIEEGFKKEKNLLTAHQSKFIWGNFNPEDEEMVDAMLKNAESAQEEIFQIEEKLEELTKKLELKGDEKDKTKQNFDKVKNELTGLSSQRETLIKVLKKVKLDDYEKKSEAEINRQISELRQNVKNIEKKYHQFATDITAIKAKKDSLKGSIDTGEKSLNDEQSLLENFQQKLDLKIDQSKFQNVSGIRTILKTELNLEQEKETLQTFRTDFQTAEQKLAEINSQTEAKEYSEEQHRKLSERVRKLKQNLEELREQAGEHKSKIERLTEALDRRTKLQKELEILILRGRDITTLKNLFKGSGFVNYVSSVYLQNLCNAANERFYTLTRKNLRLELADDNSFLIRDFLNEGKVRSVKTLSGGQTFQAALSLALALAESIQRFNQSEDNFFFLDEGFGSQDKESLQVVFNTLKSLRKENRIVGIISHVEELQQEIDTWLQIKNDEEKGSMIRASWDLIY